MCTQLCNYVARACIKDCISKDILAVEHLKITHHGVYGGCGHHRCASHTGTRGSLGLRSLPRKALPLCMWTLTSNHLVACFKMVEHAFHPITRSTFCICSMRLGSYCRECGIVFHKFVWSMVVHFNALVSGCIVDSWCGWQVSETFAEMIFRHGFVHCDPHAANMLLRLKEGWFFSLFGAGSHNWKQMYFLYKQRKKIIGNSAQSWAISTSVLLHTKQRKEWKCA